MSVDMIMYKAKSLDEYELSKIAYKNVADLDEMDGWELKFYTQEEVHKNPARFTHIGYLLRPVELLYTRTDYKACCIAHGMPEDTNSYSISHGYNGVITACFGKNYIRLTPGELDEFTTTKQATYYVVKRKDVDAEISNWVARSLMTKFEDDINGNESVDLGYTPIHLNAKYCEVLCKSLVKLYDEDELYPDADLAQFMLEIMREVYRPFGSAFIEFQD